MYGPGWRRKIHRFGSELELATFQAEHEQRLLNPGFTFEGFCEDRRDRCSRSFDFCRPEPQFLSA